VDAYGPALVITRSTPERQTAAWLLLKWLVSPPNQARWAIASGYAPVRPSALELMQDALKSNPQWAAALALLPYAHREPSYASWSVVRRMLGDALKQLLTPDFPAEQIPDLMQTMEQLAEEIHLQVR
jgi:multiple sugar transport system substrate-binding protein